MASFSQDEIRQILAEDPLDKNRVLLSCKRHRYVASSTPPQPLHCKECWEAYFWYMIASTPPHLREERLHQLETAVRHACEEEDRGEFTFEPFDHPEFKIERDVSPDKLTTKH